MEISNPFVLGMSFLKRTHAKVDFGSGTIQLHIGDHMEQKQIKATAMPITCMLNKKSLEKLLYTVQLLIKKHLNI